MWSPLPVSNANAPFLSTHSGTATATSSARARRWRSSSRRRTLWSRPPKRPEVRKRDLPWRVCPHTRGRARCERRRPSKRLPPKRFRIGLGGYPLMSKPASSAYSHASRRTWQCSRPTLAKPLERREAASAGRVFHRRSGGPADMDVGLSCAVLGVDLG